MIYKIREAVWAAFKALKMPMMRLHSYSWKLGDHKHICLAARLLEPDDFGEVCPLPANAMLEHEDPCDECPYFSIVCFDTRTDGKHTVSIYTKGDWQP